jgi:diguanylate cyclase (GGDEF)-like protein
MIAMDQALKIKEELLAILDEDVRNKKRILQKFESIRNEKGITPYSALLLILTHLPYEENEAKRHWEAILDHRQKLSRSMERDVGLRVALFDYFINLNKIIEYPKIIELSLFEKLDRFDHLDFLTGLLNQRYFQNVVSTEMRRSKRYHLKCSVVIMDTDDFKEVNEKYGSLIGDILLKETSMIIRNSIRDIDTAARSGGGEFALLLPETGRLGSYIVSERIRISAENHFKRRKVNGASLNLTLSGGISSFPEDGVTVEEMVESARQALYQAKAMGKNSINIYFRERRNFIRFDVDHAAFRIEVLKGEEKSGEMKTAPRWEPSQDISRNGILFKSKRSFGIGEPLEICFFEEDAEILKIQGRVVRIEELEAADAGKYEVGVAFLYQGNLQEETLLKLIEKFRKISSK